MKKTYPQGPALVIGGKRSVEIDSVVFDLNNTLYRQNNEMDESIRRRACEEAVTELGGDYDSVREEFDKIYVEIQSGRKTLEILGVSDGTSVMERAVENSGVDSLPKDPRLREMMDRISPWWNLALVTGTSEKLTMRTLEAIGLNPETFSPVIHNKSPYNRDDGSAFRHVAESHGTFPYRMLMVGDREKKDVVPANKFGLKTAIVREKSGLADVNLKDIYELENFLSPFSNSSFPHL